MSLRIGSPEDGMELPNRARKGRGCPFNKVSHINNNCINNHINTDATEKGLRNTI